MRAKVIPNGMLMLVDRMESLGMQGWYLMEVNLLQWKILGKLFLLTRRKEKMLARLGGKLKCSQKRTAGIKAQRENLML